jgi:hypothetical protein
VASGKTIYLQKKHLDQDFGGQAWAPPATLYFALFTARGTTAQAAAGTNFVEATGGGYARKGMANNLTTWSAATTTDPSVKSNAVAINFGTPTVTWGTIVCVGVYDSLAGGNLLYWTDLSGAVSAPAGTPVKFDIGSFTVLGSC